MSDLKSRMRSLLGRSKDKQREPTSSNGQQKQQSVSQGGPVQYLQLLLYARPRFPAQPHFALFITNDPLDPFAAGIKHDATNSIRTLPNAVLDESWRYQRKVVPKLREDGLVVVRATLGILCGGPDTMHRIDRLLEVVPCYQKDHPDPEKARMNCVDWVRRALKTLSAEEPAMVDFGKIARWGLVRQRVLEYENEKRESGRWRSEWRGETTRGPIDGIPTLELRFGLPGTELVE